MSPSFLRARSLAVAGFVALSTLGAAASTASAADTQLPTAPGTPSASGGSGGGAAPVTFSWPAATDDVGVDHYVTSNGNTPASVRSLTVMFPVDVGWSFSVKAVDAAGNVSASSPAISLAGLIFPIMDTTPPSAPSQLAARGFSSEGLVISWTPSTDNSPSYLMSGYDVYNGTTKVATIAGQVDSTTIPSIQSPDTPYSLTVVARDRYGLASAPSSALVNPPAADTTPPTAPGLPFKGASSPAGRLLTWAASTDNVGVTGYDVYDGTTKIGSTAGDVTSLPVTYLGAVDYPWSFTVKARDAAGNVSAPSPAYVQSGIGGPAVDTTPPTAPGQPTGSASDGSTSISWPAASDNVGVVGYDVYFGTDAPSSKIGSTTGLTFSRPGAPADDEVYVFYVKARDAAGNVSASSAPVSIAGQPLPPVSYGFTLAGSTTLTSLAKGIVPVSGQMNLQGTQGLRAANVSAKFTADLAPTKLTALGLPIIAKLAFAPTAASTGALVGPLSATGSLSGGVLTLTASARVKVLSATVFGVQLVKGTNCQTTQPSNITLKSTGSAFSPTQGGTIAGTFSISNLSGCGSLTGLVSPLVAGGGNALAIKLTPGPLVAFPG